MLVAYTYLPQNNLQLQAVYTGHSLQLQAISTAQNLQLQATFATHNLQLIRTSFKQQSVIQVWSLYEICQGQRCGLYHVTSLQNFLICPIIKQDRLIISPPVKVWWLLHLPPHTTLILHVVLKVYFRVPCNYHTKQPLFSYTIFTCHFSNGRIVVFSSRCEQTVCSCAVTCSQWSGGTAPYTISPLEGGQWSSPRPGRFPPQKRPSTLQVGLDGCGKSPSPGSNPAPPAVQSRSTHVPLGGSRTFIYNAD